MKNILTTFVLILSTLSVFGQRNIDGSIRYGNEWIDYAKTYYKIIVNEDGVYKVSKSDLAGIGFPTDKPMSAYKLVHLGQDVALHTTTNAVPGDSDYFIFYGEKNRDEVDRFVYQKDDMQLNPEYSIVSDQAAYFLTIDESNTNLRYSVTNSTLSASDSYANHIWAEKMQLNTNELNSPHYTGLVEYSHMVESEGYGSVKAASYSESMTLDNYTNVGQNSKVSVRFATYREGVNQYTPDNFSTNVTVKANGVSIIADQNYKIFRVDEVTGSISPSSSVNVNLTNTDSEGKLTVPYFKVEYTRDLNIGALSKAIKLRSKGANNYALSTSSTGVKVIIPGNNSLINTSSYSGKAAFPVSTAGDIVVFNDGVLKSPLSLNKGKQYTQYQKMNTNYVIISHPKFIGTTSLNAYTDYRKSTGYTPIVVDITELYDQYAYGVDRHFASIRNFSNYVHGNKYYDGSTMFFLVGRGLQYNYSRTHAQQASSDFYIPTFGYPTSDAQLFSTFDSPVPFYAYGRLSVKETKDIDNYLRRIKATESNPISGGDNSWMKEVLHLDGGGQADYQQLKSNMTTIESGFDAFDKMGAQVTTIVAREDTAPVFNAYEEINSGKAIVTSMGHGGIDRVDFNIGGPENLDNAGKLPIYMVLGCSAGNCCTPMRSLGERFVIHDGDTGVAVFIATSGKSYGYDLDDYGKYFYENYGGDHYGKAIGPSIVSAIQKSSVVKSISMVSTLEQVNLQGDPAYKMYAFEGADIQFDYSSITVSPEPVTSVSEMTFCVDVLNKGMGQTGMSFDITTNIEDADGNVLATQTQTKQMISFIVNGKTKVCQTFNLKDLNLDGDYKITSTIKPSIEESAEGKTNNTLTNPTTSVAGYPLKVLGKSLYPTFPEEYSIVNTTNVTLVATSFDAFDGKDNFVVEIDTVPSFDSDYLQTKQISDSYVPVKVENVTLLNKEDQVYYWRVKYAAGNTWRTSSFVYNSTSGPGWNQSHYGQYYKDDLYQTVVDENNLSYVKDNTCFAITNAKNAIRLFRSGTEAGTSPFKVSQGFGISIIKENGRYKGTQWFNAYNVQGSPNSVCFEYLDNTSAERAKLINALNTKIADGETIILYSIRKTNTQYSTDWNNEIYTYLRSAGATKLDDLKANSQAPYILVMNRVNGKYQVVDELVGENSDSEINWTGCVEKYYESGTVTTTPIGKSKGYTKLIWNSDPIIKKDIYRVEVIGVDANGNESLLKSYTTPGEYDLSSINAASYPNLKLRYVTSDRDGTKPKLNMLRVLYNGVPDLVLERPNTSAGLTTKGQVAALIINPTAEVVEYEQNSTQNQTVQVTNYSTFDSPAFNVNYSITDGSGNTTTNAVSVSALPKGETTSKIVLPLETSKLGDHALNVTVNETKTPTEEEYINNGGQFEYVVKNSLPIVLEKFEAEARDNDAVLSWTTSSEINNSHFNILRSTDGVNYDKVGQVKGAGNSTSLLDYSFVDSNANVAEVVYYKLEQVDFDGSSVKSDAVSVMFTTSSSVAIYPNPVRNTLKVSYRENAQVNIYNTLGVLVAQENTGEINVSTYPAGSYIVNVIDANNNVIANETIIVVK